MFRATRCIVDQTFTFKSFDLPSIIENSPFYQCVRWRRKPRWIPVAKSKMFRIPKKFNTPEEERVELTRLNSSYNTQVKAVRHYLHLELEHLTATSDMAHIKVKQEEEDHALCVKLNEDWNMEVAKIREERLTIEAEAHREVILQRIVYLEQKEKEKLEKIEQIVREEKAKVSSYITAENIDEAIEAALVSEVDYNFSIDLEGNIYKGHHTKPLEQEEKLQASVKAS